MKTIKLLQFLTVGVAFAAEVSCAIAAQESYTAQIQSKPLFSSPIQWIGTQEPPGQESAALLKGIGEFETKGIHAGFASLEKFLTENPQSAWATSLHVNMAEHYRNSGRYSLALRHWEKAWVVTKSSKDSVAQKLAARGIAGWTRLLASLGEKEKLTKLFTEVDALQLPLGSYGTMVEETKGGLAMMTFRPEDSYRCGTYALGHLAKALDLVAKTNQAVFEIGSPDSGFRMSQLVSIAQTSGIPVLAVRRPVGGEIIVPSVIHWKLNHYAAIMEKKGDRYRIIDPTFEGQIWMEAKTIEAEASGAFLVPKDIRPADWPLLSKAECSEIYGKGYPSTTDHNEDEGCPPCCDDEDADDSDDPPSANDGSDGGDPPFPPDDPSDCPGTPAGSSPQLGSSSGDSAGMPQWGVSEPYITLWLQDVPLFYHMSNGKEMKLKLTYKHRDEPADSQMSGFGSKWNCDWIRKIQTHSASAPLAEPIYFKGGWRRFNTAGAPHYKSGQIFEWVTAFGNPIRPALHSAGGKLNYLGHQVGTMSGNTNYFLTQRADRYGRPSIYNYGTFGTLVKLTNVVDMDGLTNTLTYGNGTYPNLITAVTDPYGRSAYFNYDGSGRLTNIVDMAGLPSYFQYDSSDNITNMITPYGQTSFEIFTGASTNFPFSVGGTNMYSVRRSLRITEPTGTKQLYAFCDSGPSEVEGSVHRRSYHWNRAQYERISAQGKSDVLEMPNGDYLLASTKHWLGSSATPPITISDTMKYSAGPTENEYVNRPGYIELKYQGSDGSSTGSLKRVTHVYGRGSELKLQITRNSLGRPTSFTHYNGGSTATYTNFFDSSGKYLQRVIGPDNQLVRGYGYHPIITNLLTSVTNAVTNVISYTHDTNTMKVTSITFPGGLVRTNIYFSSGPNKGFLQIQADIDFRTNYFAYQNGNLTIQTNELGLVTTYLYDDLNRLVSTAFPDGTTISNIYDKLDLVRVKDRLNQWTRYGFNEVQQLVAVTNVNDQVTQYSYCGCGSPDQITRWNGATPLTTTFEYDLAGRTTNVIYPDGYQLSHSYNAENVVNFIEDNAGHYLSLGILSFGLGHKYYNATFSDGSYWEHSYDKYGRLRQSIDHNYVVTTNGYDVLGRLIARRSYGYYSDQTGLETFQYDARGLSNYTDQLGYNTRFVRDAAGRLLFQTNANNEVLQFTYNPADELLTLTDGKNQTTTWKYDQEGRVTNKTDAANNILFAYKYDANSRLTNRWSAAKSNTFYKYDPIGNLTNVTYASSPSLQYSYDPLNRLTAMLDGIGTTAFTWTDANQLASEDGPWASDAVTYSYTNRLRSRLSLAQPNTSPWVQDYGYDGLMRLSQVTSPAGRFSETRSSILDIVSLPSGTGYKWYDGLHRLTSTDISSINGTYMHEYTYNDGSQRTEQILTTDGSRVHKMNYTYDNIGQLKTAKGFEQDGTTPRLQEQFGYAYDAAWNLNYRTNHALVQTFNVNSVNELTTATRAGTLTVAGQTTLPGSSLNSVSVSGTGLSTANATIYADGSWARTNATLDNGVNTYTAVATDTRSPARTDTDVVSVNLPASNTFVYDLNGNLRTNNSRVFDYDDENQLVRITESNTWKSEFSYDGMMRRRIRKEFAWTGAAWLQTNEIRYVYDGMLAIQERDANNLALVTYTRGADLSGSLQGAGGIGGLLARTENSKLVIQNSGDAHAYYFCDGNGNVTAMINSNGIVVARYNYDPYGNLLGMSGPLAEANTYRFSSKEFHAASSLYYYGYRFYAPSLQRWLNRDPVGDTGSLIYAGPAIFFSGNEASSGLADVWLLANRNLFSFGGNLSLGVIDPWGLESYCLGISGTAGFGIYGGGGVNIGFTDSAQVFIQFQAVGMAGVGPFVGVGGTLGYDRGENPPAGYSMKDDVHSEINAAHIIEVGLSREGDPRDNPNLTVGVPSPKKLGKLGAGEGAMIATGMARTVTFATPMPTRHSHDSGRPVIYRNAPQQASCPSL